MKKVISIVLSLVMLLALVACTTEIEQPTDATEETLLTEATEATVATEATETTEATEESTEADVSGTPTEGAAMHILQSVWASYGDGEKFFAMGGDSENLVDGMPGAVSLSDPEAVQNLLNVPAAELAKVDEAVSLIHAMNVNNFTCGAFHLTDAATAGDFATAMKTHVQNVQWICGFPETLLIAQVNGDCVVSCYGSADIMATFKDKLVSLYPDTVILVEEALQ